MGGRGAEGKALRLGRLTPVEPPKPGGEVGGGGGGGWGGVGGGEGGGGGEKGGGPLGGASTASGPGEPSACGPRFPRGGTHLRQKKGSEKWLGGGFGGGCLF